MEILSKLIEEKQIEVIYSLDGKEYVTPSQLFKEIRDELIVHGGRHTWCKIMLLKSFGIAIESFSFASVYNVEEKTMLPVTCSILVNF